MRGRFIEKVLSFLFVSSCFFYCPNIKASADIFISEDGIVIEDGLKFTNNGSYVVSIRPSDEKSSNNNSSLIQEVSSSEENEVQDISGTFTINDEEF